MRSSLSWVRYIILPLFLGQFAACDDPASPEKMAAAKIEIVKGDGQVGPAGEELDQQVVVRVLDVEGNPVDGIFVLWTGDGVPWVDVTDTASDGITRNYWSLGDEPGSQEMELWAYDLETGTRGKFLGSVTATAEP